MKVKDLISALSAYDGEAEVLVTDMMDSFIEISSVDDGYKKYGLALLAVKHMFPEEWFNEDEDGNVTEVTTDR